MVVDASQFLGSQENSNSLEDTLEFKSLENSIVVLVCLLEPWCELQDVVNALGAQLALDLVDDHVDLVSPVCHNEFIF